MGYVSWDGEKKGKPVEGNLVRGGEKMGDVGGWCCEKHWEDGLAPKKNGAMK